MREDNHRNCAFTTMFDLYALPPTFPGYELSLTCSDPYSRVKVLEDAFKEDIGDLRFVPYIQVHEFEALLLSDPRAFVAEYLEHADPIEELCRLVAEFGHCPEMIDGGAQTAPSKRILDLIPGYDKRESGPHIAERVGLSAIRQKGPHYREWLEQLERL